MMPDGAPDLDRWLPKPSLRVQHARRSSASAEALWRAARAMRLRDAGLLGRLVQWRIPGTAGTLSFEELFRTQPFVVLEELELGLVSGIVGRIWTLRRDYPALSSAEDFRDFHASGSARVVFATWAAREPDGGGRLANEVRVQALGTQGRFGVAAVRPLVRAFHPLIGSEGLLTAVRRAEKG